MQTNGKQRYQQFSAAAETYLEQTRQREDVLGIIVSGSFIHGEVDPNSDIDVYVVLDDWKDPEALTALKSYVANLLGGERSREWQLRSHLDL